MLAYAAHRPLVGARRSSPQSMLVVVAVHVAVVAVVMSAKMEMPVAKLAPPLRVDFIDPPVPPAPLPEKVTPAEKTAPRQAVTELPAIVPLPSDATDLVPADPVRPIPGLDGPMPGPGDSGSTAQPRPVPATPAILLTSPAELKPPYPASRLASGEEAVLKLRLSIGTDGRVVAVEPLGRADRAFVESARRHIIGHWRYRPASREGQPVATTLVVTLRFQLDD